MPTHSDELYQATDRSIPQPRPRVLAWQSVAMAHAMVAGLHLIWGALYIYHWRMNPALPGELWWMLMAGGLPFLATAALARLMPRGAALLGLLALVAVHVGIAAHFNDIRTLGGGAVFKALMLVILLRALVMSSARQAGSRG